MRVLKREFIYYFKMILIDDEKDYFILLEECEK